MEYLNISKPISIIDLEQNLLLGRFLTIFFVKKLVSKNKTCVKKILVTLSHKSHVNHIGTYF